MSTSLQGQITKNDISKIPNKIFLFDGHNLIYKAYFALPKFYDQSGRPTGAIQGACNMLLKFLLKYQNAMFCIASDSGGKNFRHDLFEAYKANRVQIDDDLRKQIIAMQDIYKVFGLNVIGNHGFEADDYIASFVKKFSNDYVIFIISSDKDLMQLVGRNVFMIDPVKDDFFDEEAVEKKFGVRPKAIGDYLSLIGDSSDNIPGVTSVGPKTALKILSYGNLEKSIENNFENIPDKKLQDKLRANLSDLLLSKKLVLMNSDLEINLKKEDLALNLKAHARNIYETFLSYNLNSLSLRIEKFLSSDEISSIKDAKENPSLSPEFGNIKQLKNHPNQEFLDELDLTGSCCMNFIQNEENFILQIFARDAILMINKIDDENQSFLMNLMKNASIRKITFKIHYNLQKFFKKYKIFEQQGIYDLSCMYFNFIGIKANENFHYLVQCMNLDAAVADKFAALESEYIFLFGKLFEFGLQKLREIAHLNHFELDRKVYLILLAMEHEGILIDREKLKELENYFDAQMDFIKSRIIDETGYDFNIISPKQTSEILFDKLGIAPIGKKSMKTNAYGTDMKILEELSGKGISVAHDILEYRSLNKLKTSYCQSLAEKIDPITHRIHTTFWLNGATTGRILSSDPNLQNIPTRTLEGKKIRECFIAKDGYVLLSIDYSQIELRILAYAANVKNLQDAFLENVDVHQLTASQIFGIRMENVDEDHRSKAKAINFGIIYGISPYGLSKQLKIPVSEASFIIKNYFLKYPEIEAYLSKTKEFFHKNGYVLTMFGRKCYSPNFSYDSGFDVDEELQQENEKQKANFFQQQFLDRAAINASIQGTVADIIKRALLHINHYIKKEKFDAEILLQIHDEIIFEVRESEIKNFLQSSKEIMEQIGQEINLYLKVDVEYDKNWS